MSKALALAALPHPGTGPYRRIWSLPGFAAMEATIVLPPPDAIVMDETPPFKDVAFTYAGGWGEDGHAVDAGLQYSPLHHDWSLIVLSTFRDNPDGSKKHSAQVHQSLRFPAGSRLRLRFEVVGPNSLRVEAKDLSGHDERVRELAWDSIQGVTGWRPGGEHVFKRMVSIAQGNSGGATERLQSGSILRDLRWENVELIRSNGERIPWQLGHADAATHPKGSAVNFQHSDFNAETVTIDLR